MILNIEQIIYSLTIFLLYSLYLEFGRSRVLIHPKPIHTKDSKNGTASMCDKRCECICRRVAPDYAADLSLQILDLAEIQNKGRSVPHPLVVGTNLYLL